MPASGVLRRTSVVLKNFPFPVHSNLNLNFSEKAKVFDSIEKFSRNSTFFAKKRKLKQPTKSPKKGQKNIERRQQDLLELGPLRSLGVKRLSLAGKKAIR